MKGSLYVCETDFKPTCLHSCLIFSKVLHLCPELWDIPSRFVFFKSWPNNGYHMKGHEKLFKSSTKHNRLFQGKEVTGSIVGCWTFFYAKNGKIAYKSQYRLVSSYYSSKTNSSDDTPKILTCMTFLK